MEDNPYSAIAKMMQSPKGWLLDEGTVVSASPLKITAFGLPFAGGEIRVNAQLLGGWSQQVRIAQTVTDVSGLLTATGPALAAGDRVLVLSVDGQTLYVLCKVVSG